MANHAQVHPQWGRPLDEYVQSWGMDSVRKRVDWDARSESEIRNRASVAISRICDLANETKVGSETRVTISMLHSILELTQSPGTFAELGYPGLIGGCIKLMQSVKFSDQPAATPFRFEYGYLSFRILIIALDVSFLQRAKLFDATVSRMRAETNTELLLVLSEEVSRLLSTLTSDSEGMDRCHSLLGLRTPDRSDCSPQRPFTSIPEAVQLLTLLCMDSRHFSKALDSTYSPGLSLVLCLFWGYIQMCDDWTIEIHDPYLKSKFCEVYFRYCLVALPSEDIVLVSIYNRIIPWVRAAHSARRDNEGEKAKFLTYIGRFAPVGTAWLSQPSITLLPILLQYLLTGPLDGLEDLLPRTFGLTIDRLWEARINKEVPVDRLLEVAADTMSYMGRALDRLVIKSYSDQLVISELLDALIHHDIFDFIVQTTFTLPERSKDLPRKEDPNMQFIEVSVAMWELVGKILPKDQLRLKFQAILPEIRKYVGYALQWIDMGEESTARRARFRLMSQCVVCIGYIVGFEKELDDAKLETGFCAYERCGHPLQREISQFACGECGATYCGRNCLAKEWMYGSLRKWHKISCGNVLPYKVDVPWSVLDRVTRAFTEGPNPFPIEDFMH